jgi:hypothetical protein
LAAYISGGRMLAAALRQDHPSAHRNHAATRIRRLRLQPIRHRWSYQCGAPFSGRVSVSRTVERPCGFLLRDIEGPAMAEDGKSWWFGPFGRGDLATQAAVLLPVMAIAVMSAWTMGARGQSVEPSVQTAVAVQGASPGDPAPAKAEAAPPPAASAVNGLKITSQSWRRGGLGSNALFNFTVRNTNDYAVGDIEVACTFVRHDGSRLTERKRVIPDAVVRTKSRNTFARVHIGFVNVNADKAKCALVAASRL